eukprot:scaffold88735_cov28-Tisochrysis_lutea.AAC.7
MEARHLLSPPLFLCRSCGPHKLFLFAAQLAKLGGEGSCAFGRRSQFGAKSGLAAARCLKGDTCGTSGRGTQFLLIVQVEGDATNECAASRCFRYGGRCSNLHNCVHQARRFGLELGRPSGDGGLSGGRLGQGLF